MPVESLGIGQQQMVAIAKALLGESKVLIFDEPTAALTEAEADKLFDIIAGLRARELPVFIFLIVWEKFSVCRMILR